MKKARIVAEIGCNHMGNIDMAKKMISIAKLYCEVDIVKFQKRDNDYWSILKPKQYFSEHPNPVNSYGDTYLEHRKALEFTKEQHKELMDYCNEIGIEYSTSVWDLKSAQEITELNPKMIKIPSACNNNYEMLQYLCDNYFGEIHISIGMTTDIECEEMVKFFEKNNRAKDVVLYSCTSGYPVSDDDVCLLEIKKIKEKYQNRVKDIGFSGHHNGIVIDTVAYSLGANVIERHYTLNKKFKGTDHVCSLEPEEFKTLINNLNTINKAMAYKNKEILDVEKIQREKLKFENK